MASSSSSNRRGQLSRPGVCTPPPLPGVPAPAYSLVIVHWGSEHPYPEWIAELTATSPDIPPTEDGWWSYETNGEIYVAVRQPYPPDKYKITGEVHWELGVLYIHATLTRPATAPVTYSVFEPIPEPH